MRETPWTVDESTALPEDTKLQMLKAAKAGTWYDGWQPYCMTCSTMNRMHKEPYGFRCRCCGNMIAWDLTRLAESPLNRKAEARPLHHMSGNADQEARIRRGIERYRDMHHPTCLITDVGNDHLMEILSGADFPIVVGIPERPAVESCGYIHETRRVIGHLPDPVFMMEAARRMRGLDDFAERSYMKPPEYAITRGEYDQTPDPICERHSVPDETDKYSRKGYSTPGDIGRPTKHRRTRKMKRQSRRDNRRK